MGWARGVGFAGWPKCRRRRRPRRLRGTPGARSGSATSSRRIRRTARSTSGCRSAACWRISGTSCRRCKLPQPLTIKIEGCGVVNAYYSSGAVTICYEYIAWIHQIAQQVTLSNEISLEDAVVGPFVDVLLHEVAHAIFDLLKIPLFGREEDAADQLAAFILLQFGNDVARRTIVGAALLFRQMAIDQQPGTADYAAVHGLPAQRFINVLCIAYGAQPQAVRGFRQAGLPAGAPASAIAAGSTSRSRTPSRR